MFEDTQAVRTYFFKLGLVPEFADIYLALLAHGRQSLSDLSRNARIERTKIYRLLDDIEKSGLIKIDVEYKKKFFSAEPIENLQILIAKKEQNLEDLKKDFDAVQKTLQASTKRSNKTTIRHYRGVDGLKQMYWNETKGSGENLSILHENMQIRTGATFFERWARACNENNLQFRGIINDTFIKSQQEWYGQYSNERLKNWQSGYLPDSTFLLQHSIVVYDNVTAYYNWQNGEIFGLEMINQQVADTQRQFFESLWKQATIVDDLHGLSE